ncbi:putative transposase [Tolypothrix tenuis PCC 7101]|uniref:Putative transposase n=1 Tax=Tolypothrix tenuis PCC 7101 TaxID=231146 RepID=A0A1Z4N2B4_9CYAN|nr:putative transposase [Tolypothrix tenuis PCC 7101]BAZ76223.1 putative transposase [Aulosira laxa NIES-50]
MSSNRYQSNLEWQQVFEVLAEDADNEYAMIDSTIVRAHQHSVGAKGGMRLGKPSDAVRVDCNTCRLRGKGEGEKGQEKTFNPYPLTFSQTKLRV